MQASSASSSPQTSPMSRIFSIKKNNRPGLVAINIHSLQQLHDQGTLLHPPQLSEQSYFLPHTSRLQPLPPWSPGCCDLWNAWPGSHGNKISRAQRDTRSGAKVTRVLFPCWRSGDSPRPSLGILVSYPSCPSQLHTIL